MLKVVAVDDEHVSLINIENKQVSQNKSSKNDQIISATRVYDQSQPVNLISKTYLTEQFSKLLLGQDVSLLFLQNAEELPDVTQFCYCQHQQCVIQQLLDYLSLNLFNNSIISLNVTFDVFIAKNGSVVQKNVIPTQPMFPSTLLKNLENIQKMAVTNPSYLKIEVLLNQFSLQKASKSTFQVLVLPQIGKAKVFPNCQKAQPTQMRLSDQLRLNMCRCVYKQQNYQFISDEELNCERIGEQQIVPKPTQESSMCNQILFGQFKLYVAALQQIAFNKANSPFEQLLSKMIGQNTFSTLFLFVKEDEPAEIVKLSQQFRNISKAQQFSLKSPEFVLVQKDEYEKLIQAAAQKGKLNSQYYKLESEVKEYFRENFCEKVAFKAQIEAMRGKAEVVKQEVRGMKGK